MTDNRHREGTVRDQKAYWKNTKETEDKLKVEADQATAKREALDNRITELQKAASKARADLTAIDAALPTAPVADIQVLAWQKSELAAYIEVLNILVKAAIAELPRAIDTARAAALAHAKYKNERANGN